MRVVLAARARADQRDIARFIARDNPVRAVSFVRDIQTSLRALGEQPLAFPVEPRFERLGVRRKPYRDYLIFYLPTDAAVNILRILHGARDYAALPLADR